MTIERLKGGEMKKARLVVLSTLLLIAPLAAQNITVVSPNGGETLTLGQNGAIVWTAPGVTNNVKIQLIKPGGALVDVIAPSLAPGSSPYSWIIGQTGSGTATAGSYKVRISTLNGAVMDESDNSFTLADAVEPPEPGGAKTIVVTSPNGGESWPSGGMRNITWTTANWSGTVRLSLTQNGVYKGAIAKGLPSAPGAYAWEVGTTDKGSAGIGEGYKVQVSREYPGMTPHALLADSSDISFVIVLPRPDQPTSLAENIQVSIPEEGKAYEYGTDLCINQGRCVRVPIAWVSSQPGPFQLDLMDGGHVALSLLVHNDPPASGTTYSTKFLFTTQNSKPGWYRIRVRSTNGKASGSSGKFQLKYKLWDLTLQPKVMNKYHKQTKRYEYIGTLNSSGTGTSFQEKPGYIRIGFENHYDSSGSTYSYLGFLFRSRVIFDLSQFKNRKGYFKEAKLQIAGRESHHTAPANIDMSDCDVRFFILAEPWPGGDFFAIPGNLIQNFPAGAPNDFDIPEWATAWANGASPNHGLLIAGAMEKMNHDNLYCVNYYKLQLKVQFQEE
jgi:hypothetical protein